MKYFFNAIGERVYGQSHGEEFPTDEDAMAKAVVIAKELAVDGNMEGFWIVVVNEQKNEIGRVPIS
jgi:hypothetical protein